MSLIHRILLQNWQRKFLAFVGAIVIWALVNNTISGHRTLSNVRVRVVDLPAGQTVVGMHPNGELPQRIAVTLYGPRAVLDEMTPNDFEVVLHPTPGEDKIWNAVIEKNNLVPLKPHVDLAPLTYVTSDALSLTLEPIPMIAAEQKLP